MKNKVNLTLKKRLNTFKLAIMQDEIKIDNDTITEEQLNALYIYLSMTWDTMNDSEKETWNKLMEQIDKNFYEID
jgi:arsenate reductase-like glutaredoxin family protein